PERVSTAGVTINIVDPEISVVEPRTPPTTSIIFDDKDVTMAQTLIKMKEEKAKEKGVAFKDVEEPVKNLSRTCQDKEKRSRDISD
ncbi:hypothetical protein Tco_0557619, partial [Tanacetum coccineum]